MEEQKKQSGFGIAGLVMGILSIVLSCAGIGIFPAILGLIFSIIGIASKNKKKGTAIAGLVCCIIGIILGFLSASLIAAIFGTSDSGDTGTKVETSEEVTNEDESTTSEEEQSKEFAVGDVVETDNFRISFLSAEEYTEEYSTPSEGNVYYRMEFEFENISDSDQLASSYDFECYADDYSVEQSWIGDDDLNSTLSPGKKAKGAVYFEVPKDAESIVLEYETNFLSEDKVKFVVK